MASLFYVLSAWLLYRIGKKLGYENCWYAWVPILNYWMMTELAGKDTTWFIIMVVFMFCCGIVTFVMMIMLFMEIAERCGKERWWGILIIIPIVNFVIMYILGSGPAVPPSPRRGHTRGSTDRPRRDPSACVYTTATTAAGSTTALHATTTTTAAVERHR